MVLNTPNAEMDKYTDLEYLEIGYTDQVLRTTLIPLTPCISRHFLAQNPFHDIPSAPVGIVQTHRTSVFSRLSLGTGLSLGEAILVNSTTIGFTLGHKLTFKLTKQRMVDTTVGCYSNRTGTYARIYGYIPVLQVTPHVRKISYNTNEVVVDRTWKTLKPKKIMYQGPVRTLCDVGTRNEMQCESKSGNNIDQYGNALFWENL
ncbi:hypothetical protein G210_1409, partial [Candida maltosa Xu316]